MSDAINPAHYQGFSNGAQVIDITEHLSFCRGNAIKYIARAGNKDPDKEIEDLEKALWYVQREIELTRRLQSVSEFEKFVVAELSEQRLPEFTKDGKRNWVLQFNEDAREIALFGGTVPSR